MGRIFYAFYYQMTEVRGQKTEDPSSRFELRRGTQRSEDRRWEVGKVRRSEGQKLRRSEEPVFTLRDTPRHEDDWREKMGRWEGQRAVIGYLLSVINTP